MPSKKTLPSDYQFVQALGPGSVLGRPSHIWASLTYILFTVPGSFPFHNFTASISLRKENAALCLQIVLQPILTPVKCSIALAIRVKIIRSTVLFALGHSHRSSPNRLHFYSSILPCSLQRHLSEEVYEKGGSL